jgi:flagellar L-ring protein precursor FlgH
MQTGRIKLGLLTLTLLAVAGCATRPPRLPAWKPVAPTPVMTQPTPGAIYRESDSQGWFAADRAHRVGDILTIVLAERTQASKKAATTTSKKDNINLGGITVFGHSVPSGGKALADLSSKRGFDGSGSSSQSDQLNGQITATVTRRLANGNLVVQGQTWVVINQGSELVRLIGVVRPEDIGADNTIPSTRVANARIAYTGTGALADANAQGWLSRFFDSKWVPF